MARIEGFEAVKKSWMENLTNKRVHGIDLLESNDGFLDRSLGFWTETNRAANISMRLLSAGVELPSSVDLASILMGDHGLLYLQKTCAGFGISEVETLSPPSRWILVCLFRTVPSYYDSIIHQLQGFPAYTLEYYTNLRRLVHEINTSQESFRNYFLLSLSIGGTARMVEPLLTAALELGAHVPCFVEQALRRNNNDVALLLLKHGTVVTPDTASSFLNIILANLGHFQATKSAGCLSELLEILLKVVGPLPDLEHDHYLFELLGTIFVSTLYWTDPNDSNSEPGDRDPYDNRISQVLLEAGLYHGIRLPKQYWNRQASPFHTPLMLAIALKRTRIVRLLLENGYDPNELLPPGATTYIEILAPPLSYAIWLGLPDIVEILLQAGADVTKRGRCGRPPWRMSADCCETSHPRLVYTNLKNDHNKTVSENTDTQISTKIRSHVGCNRRPSYQELEAEWRLRLARGEFSKFSGRTFQQYISEAGTE